MTLNTISDPLAPPAPAATPCAAMPSTAAPAPPAPAFLTARQLAAALGVSRRTLTKWNQRRVIPSVCVGRVRRYELEQVRAALRARPSSTTPGSPGLGIPPWAAAFLEYHILP
jgi:excisionase family DNA binding protein